MDSGSPGSCLGPNVFLCSADLTHIPTSVPGSNALCVGHFPFPPLPDSPQHFTPHGGQKGTCNLSTLPCKGELTSFSHICASSGYCPSLSHLDLPQRFKPTVHPCHLGPLGVLLPFFLIGQTQAALPSTSQRSAHILPLPETLSPSSELHSLTHNCPVIAFLPPHPSRQLFKLELCAIHL